ncbi:UxaA family hydrolase [Achromobacter anxifer]
MMTANLALMIDPSDHVATAFVPLAAGSAIAVAAGSAAYRVVLRDAIPSGHKFAVTEIAAGSEVRKYGASIGRALCAIPAGAHIHLHNLESLRGRGDRS